MKKTTLLIMVEGIGSRFSGRIKQLEPVGGHGEIIMDFSIHDAGEAGFRKIIDVTQRKKKSSRQKLGNLIKAAMYKRNLYSDLVNNVCEHVIVTEHTPGYRLRA